MGFSDYEGRVHVQKINGGMLVSAYEGDDPHPPLPVRHKEAAPAKDTPGGRVHADGEQPEASTTDGAVTIMSGYDMFLMMEWSSSRPRAPYGAPSLPVYGRDVQNTRPLRPVPPDECPTCTAPREHGAIRHRVGCPNEPQYQGD